MRVLYNQLKGRRNQKGLRTTGVSLEKLANSSKWWSKQLCVWSSDGCTPNKSFTSSWMLVSRVLCSFMCFFFRIINDADDRGLWGYYGYAYRCAGDNLADRQWRHSGTDHTCVQWFRDDNDIALSSDRSHLALTRAYCSRKLRHHGNRHQHHHQRHSNGACPLFQLTNSVPKITQSREQTAFIS